MILRLPKKVSHTTIRNNPLKMQCPFCERVERMQRFAHHLKKYHSHQLAMDHYLPIHTSLMQTPGYTEVVGVYCCFGCGIAYKQLPNAQAHTGCEDKHEEAICKILSIQRPRRKAPKLQWPEPAKQIIHASIIVSSEAPLQVVSIQRIPYTSQDESMH